MVTRQDSVASRSHGLARLMLSDTGHPIQADYYNLSQNHDSFKLSTLTNNSTLPQLLSDIEGKCILSTQETSGIPACRGQLCFIIIPIRAAGWLSRFWISVNRQLLHLLDDRQNKRYESVKIVSHTRRIIFSRTSFPGSLIFNCVAHVRQLLLRPCDVCGANTRSMSDV